MFRAINRNNRLFMLSNFLFALSYGLWMNLRQLHLGDLGGTPVDVGTVLGIVALAGGALPLPAGLLTDHIGPKRVILGAWGIAVVGTVIAALATSWQLAGVGYAVFMLVIAANPATVTYVLLNTPQDDRDGQAERVMATVFASWPAAMIFAPALGGFIADRWGIAACLWIGALGLGLAIGSFTLGAEVRPAQTEARAGLHTLLTNRRFLTLAVSYPLVMLALYIGYALAPTYLEGVRGYSTGTIGLLFSLLSVGTLVFNYIVGRVRPQTGFIVLVAGVWAGTLLMWRTDNPLMTGLAFTLLGAISTMWLLAQTTYGQAVNPQQRGLALGITETLGWGVIAVASWLAGQLYERTPAHDLPLMVGVIAILAALIVWLALGRLVPGNKIEMRATKERTA